MRTLTQPALLALAALFAAVPLAHAQTPEAALLKQAIGQVKNNEGAKALATAGQLRDPTARALVTWLALRNTPKDVGFDRAAVFLRERPNWPSATLIRRRAEKLLFDEKRDAATVRAFFAGTQPLSGEGKLALARVLMAAGDRVGALLLVRSAWREDELSKEAEADTLASFAGMLDRADHKARADRLFYAEKTDAGLRAAERGGADLAALGRARAAVIKKSTNAPKLIEAVPAALRADPGLLFARIQYRRRRDDIAGAAQLMNEAPREPAKLVATDPWWLERRILVRKLLDKGDARMAYRIARDAATPEQENYKADQHFTAGWISLRFLKDSASALKHFNQIPELSQHPVTLARSFYWQGRALDAAANRAGANSAYEAAARYSIAYYGQLARARLGLKDLPLHHPPEPTAEERARFERLEPVAALRLLYAAGEAELAVPMYLDLAERGKDAATFALLGALAHEAGDARAMVLLGKAAYARGLLFDTLAFPLIGMPKYTGVGAAVDPAVVFAIARQESQFDQKVVSSAKAMGLMQVIAPTAKMIANKIGLAFNLHLLRTDPVYNVQIGAAELGDLMQDYRGSYILTFVGYNAGRGRAREWMASYGDPRDAKVDPIDWIERIPIPETRFYIQRVMENLQVYRVLLGGGNTLMIEADLARGRLN
jgi:soluble lytic murein transglycosylase